jgi:hypothetical protein
MPPPRRRPETPMVDIWKVSDHRLGKLEEQVTYPTSYYGETLRLERLIYIEPNVSGAKRSDLLIR